MTETLYDLIKSGKVTKVVSASWGKSTEIALIEDDVYPIGVHYDGYSSTYTKDGKCFEDDLDPSIAPYIEPEQLPTDSTLREQPHTGTYEKMESLRRQVIDLTELLCAKNDLIDTQREYIELLKSR